MIQNGYAISHLQLNDVADEIVEYKHNITTIDAGDHLINIWVGIDGKTKIMVQGTSDRVTLLVKEAA